VARRIDIELGPLRPRERPLILVTLDELLADVANLELHFGLPGPAGVLALEVVAEELLLQRDAVVGIEMRPVLDAVALEPLVLRGRAHEALEIAARVQALPAPVSRREQRHLDLRPVRHARLPEFVGIELSGQAVLVEIAAVGAELLLGQLERARY